MQIKTINRSAGHSAIAKISYNCRDKIIDIRTGEIHKYDSKKMLLDLLHSEITHKNLTLDKNYRSEIWNSAELAENRKDSRTAREYVVALPKELSPEQNIELVRAFAKELTSKYNNVADWAIHNEKDGNGNIHAHILTTTREFNPETKQLGERTAIEWNNTKCQKYNVPITQEQIKTIRKDWETIQNQHLRMAGLDLKVSCEKKLDRDTVKKHLGKEATALERKGIETEIGNYNYTIDNVIQLERQIYNNGNKLAKERAELKRLEQRQDEINNQQQELERFKRLVQENSRLAKAATERRKGKLQPQDQAEIMKLRAPAENYITAESQHKILDIDRKPQEFLTKQMVGDYEYWTDRNGDIDVHQTHININNQSNESIKLSLDIAISQFGDKLNINDNDEFITATIEVIANNECYANITLDNPEHQEILDSRKLGIEIEKVVDLDLDNIPDLDLTNAPDIDLDEPKQHEKL